MSDTPPDPQPLPYTYFRADGLALDRIESAGAAKKELEKLKKDLCQRFGASDVVLTRSGDDKPISIWSFYFSPAQEKAVPAHWETQRQTGCEGELQAIFANPPAGSPDHFFLTDYAGLMQRAFRRSRLENGFGCGEMPMKELPAGSYSGAFVRDRNVERPGASGPRHIGQIRDNVTFCFGSSSACRGSDPIDAVQMMGDWYIRVPNDAGGRPRFTPPDSLVVPIDRMMELDKQECAARFARLQGGSFDPQI